MRAQTIFNKLLSLQGAFVRQVEFLKDDTILVGVKRRTRLHRCPSCDFRTAATYDKHPRTWRHLSLFFGPQLTPWSVETEAYMCCCELSPTEKV